MQAQVLIWSLPNFDQYDKKETQMKFHRKDQIIGKYDYYLTSVGTCKILVVQTYN